ncbi:MAG: TIR domain-containing protein, partial [Chloroflexota bacterium]
MNEVFISYSRKDKSFAQKLDAALRASGRDPWVDWEDIPLTSDWWAEIQAGIEAADSFVFIISPDSASSKVCGEEIDHATLHHKRIVPLVYRDTKDVPEALTHLNWVFCRETDDFDAAFESLLTAMDTDLPWVKAHTRLTQQAVEWNTNGRKESFLLRGDTLVAAEEMQTQPDRKPRLTGLQQQYIQASYHQQDQEREQALAQAQALAEEQHHRAEEQAQAAASLRRRNVGLAGFGVVAIILAIIAIIFGLESRRNANLAATNEARAVAAADTARQAEAEAIQQAQISLSRQLLAQGIGRMDRDLDLALLLALEANRITQTVTPLDLQYTPYIKGYLHDHESAVRQTAFTSDSQTMISASADQSLIVWDVVNKEKIDQLSYENHTADTIAISSDDQTFASGGGNLVVVWDMETRQVKTTVSLQNRVQSVTFSPTEPLLAIGDGPSILLWDPITEQPIDELLAEDQGGIRRLDFSPDGQQLATAHDSGAVLLWDVAKRQQIGQPLMGHRSRVNAV